MFEVQPHLNIGIRMGSYNMYKYRHDIYAVMSSYVQIMYMPNVNKAYVINLSNLKRYRLTVAQCNIASMILS